jgi:hypothetical protein
MEHTFAASVRVVELQARLAGIGNDVAAGEEIAGASNVLCMVNLVSWRKGKRALYANGSGAAAAGEAVDWSDLRDLAGVDLDGGSSRDHADGGDEDGKGVHLGVEMVGCLVEMYCRRCWVSLKADWWEWGDEI